jgi:hypothetical protein
LQKKAAGGAKGGDKGGGGKGGGEKGGKKGVLYVMKCQFPSFVTVLAHF